LAPFARSAAPPQPSSRRPPTSKSCPCISKKSGTTSRRARHAALVLDGAGYHLATGLAVPGNITLVHQPPYAPELNPIENVWQYLRGNKLSNTIYENYDDILEKACQAWMFFANDKEQVASITTRQWAKVNL
jgi:hypothetical protein